MLSGIIELPWFVLALAIGMVVVFWYRPEPTVIVKQPTPYNVDHTTYRDAAGHCYRYAASPTHCPASGTVKFDLVGE